MGSLKILIAMSLFIAPFLALIFTSLKDIIISQLEFVTELVILMELSVIFFKHKKQNFDRDLIYIIFSMTCLFFADSIYNARLLKLIDQYGLLSDYLHSGFALFLLIYLIKKLHIFKRRIKEWLGIALLAFFLDASLSFCFLLHPYYYFSADGFLWKLNGTIYMILSVLIFSLVMPFIFRVADRKTFWFLNLILLFLIADYAIRYQDAFVDTSTFSWAEAAWCSSFVGLAWLIFLNRKKKELFISQPLILAPFISVRSLLTISICGANSLLLLSIILVKLFSLKTAIDLSSTLLLLYLFWTISNEFSIWLVSDLNHSLQPIFKVKEHLSKNGLIECKLEKVSEQSPIFELAQILESYNVLITQTNKMMAASVETNKNKTIAEIASQVSHDIRSPLAALEIIIKYLPTLPEETRVLIRNSIGRIKDIANNLLHINAQVNKTENTDINIQIKNEKLTKLLFCLIEKAISEKRVEFRSRIGIEFHLRLNESVYELFSELNVREMMRILSNLINNAVEALNQQGQVWISLTKRNQWALITIEDNGCGIPYELHSSLAQRGVSYGKEGGSGLGLYHARTTLEAWGGSIKVHSKPGKGTKVDLLLPLARSPEWFVDKLRIPAQATIVILDADLGIHQMWRNKFEKLIASGAKLNFLHLSTPKQLDQWVSEQEELSRDFIFLIDYECIDFDRRGLDLLEKLTIQTQSILVSSRYEELELRSRCKRLGLRLIPKELAAFVPLLV